jgi:hypothetical protein
VATVGLNAVVLIVELLEVKDEFTLGIIGCGVLLGMGKRFPGMGAGPCIDIAIVIGLAVNEITRTEKIKVHKITLEYCFTYCCIL